MSDVGYDHLLAATEFVLAANPDEMNLLWGRYSAATLYAHPAVNVHEFEQVPGGWNVAVGHVGWLPVRLGLNWWRIDGMLTLAWWGMSRVTDAELAEFWLHDHCAPTWEGRPASADVANFGAVLRCAAGRKALRPPG